MTNTFNQPLTEKQRKDVLHALIKTGSRDLAADYAGVTVSDIIELEKQDEAFGDEVRQHKFKPEYEILDSLMKAAKDPKQWRASLSALQLMEPDRYAKRNRDEITMADVQEMVKSVVAIVAEEVPSQENMATVQEKLRQEIKKLIFPTRKNKKGQSNELHQ